MSLHWGTLVLCLSAYQPRSSWLDGYWCPAAKYTPGHQETSWWLKCGFSVTWLLLQNIHRVLQPLTHCGPVRPSGDTDLCQQWHGWWLVAWWYQAITWPNLTIINKVHWHSSEGNYAIYIPQPSITTITLKITSLKFHSHLPGADELKHTMFEGGVKVSRLSRVSQLLAGSPWPFLTASQLIHMQIPRAWISNYIPQYSMGCNYICMS